MAAQEFGGQWSLIKLDKVEAYFNAFNLALKNQPFDRIYIDAFAGSGDFTFPIVGGGPLFNPTTATQTHAGSARRALDTDPPFHRLYFIENDSKNLTSLQAIAAVDPMQRACVVAGDANVEVRKICADTNWNKTRGVIFLDPFGNSVDWETLKAVAKTKLDIWYLFPLSGVYRNAPIDQAALTSDKRATITRIVGTDEWERCFYEPPPDMESNLFNLPAPPGRRRQLDVDGIEAFVRERLATLFPYVAQPIRLLGPTKAPMYSLFFAMANPASAAHAVAKPIAAHILRGW
jgi:three-Cys-motif partner protein